MLSFLAAMTFAENDPATCPVHLAFAYGELSTVRTQAHDGFDDGILSMRVRNVGSLAQRHGTHQRLIVMVEGTTAGSRSFPGLDVAQSAVLTFHIPVPHERGPTITVPEISMPLEGRPIPFPVARSHQMIRVSMHYVLDDTSSIGNACTMADDAAVADY